MLTGKEWSLILASYVAGCFTAGYYYVRWRTGRDIRELGSGSVGARNVGRAVGWGGFVVTFLADFGKGALVAGTGLHFGFRAEVIVAAMLAVVVGHNWPMQLRFHGGKGIATSFGAVIAYDPFVALVLVGLFAPVYLVLRSFTLSGLLAFALSPLVVFLWGAENAEVAALSFLAILALVSHRKNIREEIARSFPHRPVKEAPMHTDQEPRP